MSIIVEDLQTCFIGCMVIAQGSYASSVTYFHLQDTSLRQPSFVNLRKIYCCIRFGDFSSHTGEVYKPKVVTYMWG